MKKITMIILVTILNACKPEPIININKGFSRNDFPIEVGNWWRYKITDFYGGIDTLKIVVISKVEDNSSKIYRCNLIKNQLVIDSSTIELSDGVFIYKGLNTEYSYFGDVFLKLPFEEDSNWSGFSDVDSTKVTAYIENPNFTINGISYKPVYTLKRNVVSFGYSLTQFIIISPKIGIINQSIDLFNGSNVQKQQFDLIDYNLN